MKKVCHVLELDRIAGVLQRRCDSKGVTLTWSARASTASTDGKNIILPVPKQPITLDAMQKLYGFVVHESGHHSRPDAFEILKSSGGSAALCAIYNIVEDAGMEREVAGEYQGDARALGEGNNVILREVTESWKEQFEKYEDRLEEVDVAPLACCGLGQLARIEWDGWSNGSRAQYMNALPPEGKKLLDELVNEGWVKRFQTTKDPHDTWDVAVDLYKRLFGDEDNDEEIESVREKGHAMDGPSTDAGEPSTGDSDDTEGDAKDVDEADKGKPYDEGKVVSWKDAVLSEHEWQQKPDGVQPGNLGIDWEDYTKGSVTLMPADLINVIDCRNNSVTAPEPDEGGGFGGIHSGSPASFMSDNTQARQFANQIRRYIQAQARTKVQTEKYHGRLDKRSIVKLALPPIDGGDWNKRLFYDEVRAKALDTCIHVLTDWSGSMQGQKMIHAADASGRLVHTFDRVLRVPVQLAAFSNGRTRCDIGLIKAFDQRSVSPMDVATAFSRFYKFSSANNDADALMWAYRQIMKRKEERKIIIVLSDGCPAGSWSGGSSSDNLKYVAKMIQLDKGVELYGVGIQSNAVQNYYENFKVLQSSEDINNTLFSIIKEGVKR